MINIKLKYKLFNLLNKNLLNKNYLYFLNYIVNKIFKKYNFLSK